MSDATIKYTFPSMEVLRNHFSVEAFWSESILKILEDHFAGREFSMDSLAHALVIWFPEEERMAVLDELKKFVASQSPVATS